MRLPSATVPDQVRVSAPRVLGPRVDGNAVAPELKAARLAEDVEGHRPRHRDRAGALDD